ncbi:MAG: hypothetical protein H8E38_00740 [SAR324 cluster bacterium]|nr:hypothetical protein [SAR324 cluster bacterium]MBL7035959.1 hypothetical protein [SAR324 cluster bacterium]
MKRKIILTLFAVSSLIFTSSQAFALLSVSAGVPISHTITGKGNDGSKIETDGVSGVFMHVSLPILVGLGIESYKTKIKSTSTVELETSMYDIFYMLPIPVINLTVGLGAGSTELKCSICSDAYDKGKATQWYASVGVPFLPFFDMHLSYRSVSSKIKIKAAYGGGEDDFSGNVTGVGIMFSF